MAKATKRQITTYTRKEKTDCMSKIVIVKSKEGFTVAEVSNYTYDNIETAVAFARDKWGDDTPSMAVAAGSLPYACPQCGTTDPTNHTGGYAMHAM